MTNILKWWLDYLPLTEEEDKDIHTTRNSEIIYNDDEYIKLEDEYFSRMPFCNVSSKTRHITFEDSATTFINKLFSKYVDDETLVICSDCEHDNVKENVKKCKNKLILSQYGDIQCLNIRRVVELCNQYKKVFVYIIGTQISTGEITPQEFFVKLKKYFNDNNIKNTIVIDDVHGMFITPRDYSIFDYVIYTAHALVRYYDMGVLISREGNNGIRAYNWGNDYLKLLDIILKRKDKLNLFRTVMTEYFSDYLATINFALYKKTCNNIFSIKCNLNFTKKMIENLDKYEIRIEGAEFENKMIRFRAQQYIKEPQFLLDGVDLLREYISILEYK